MDEKQFNAMPEKERKNRVLKGIAYYASVHTPNLTARVKFKSDPVYRIYVGLDTEEELTKAVTSGLKIHEPTEKIPHKHVKIDTKIKPREGKSDEERFEETKPLVVDSLQNEIPDTILIGNGSRVAVKFSTYWHAMSNQHGPGTWIKKVQVRELVPYSANSQDEDLIMDDSGFVLDAPNQSVTPTQALDSAVEDFDVDDSLFD